MFAKVARVAVLVVAPLGCSFQGAASGGGDRDADPGGDAATMETLTLRPATGDAIEDSWIEQGAPALGADGTLVIDGFRVGGGTAIGLLRFDFLGDGAREVPAGSQILGATLELTVGMSGSGTPGGDPVSLCPSLIDWDEQSTWDSLQAPFDAGTDYVQAGCVDTEDTSQSSIGHSISVDAGAAVASWAAGDVPNFGWLLLPTGTDGTNFFSSEAVVTEGAQPTLVVDFIRP